MSASLITLKQVMRAIIHTDNFCEDGQLLIGDEEAGLVTLGKLFASGIPHPTPYLQTRGTCQPVPGVSENPHHACYCSIPTHVCYSKRQMMHGCQASPRADGLAPYSAPLGEQHSPLSVCRPRQDFWLCCPLAPSWFAELGIFLVI